MRCAGVDHFSFDEFFNLQAEFQNVIDLVSKFGSVSCLSASISWNPQRSEVRQSSFVLGFSSNTPALNSAKVLASSFASEFALLPHSS